MSEELGSLLERYRPDAIRMALTMAPDWDTAEDIVQEASIKAWLAFPQFDRAKPFRPWFFKIVANEAKMWTRNTARERRDTSLDQLMDDGWDIADTEDVVHF